jgi:MoaA/NifB/PqqE/SkfB family radical SAM enzyme
MPCKVCREVFAITPCNHPTGIFEKSLDTWAGPYFYGTSTTNKPSVMRMKRYYRLLKEKCSCKDCLINPICIGGRQCVLFETNNGATIYFPPSEYLFD